MKKDSYLPQCLHTAEKIEKTKKAYGVSIHIFQTRFYRVIKPHKLTSKILFYK